MTTVTRLFQYRCLSTRVQRVILRLGLPPYDRSPETSSAESAACSARDLELSSSGGEARALRVMGDSLYRLHYVGEENKSESYAAVIAAAEQLRTACPEFVNPPLSGIWASMTENADGEQHGDDDAETSREREDGS